jgi:SAM-dependent methyltransferase
VGQPSPEGRVAGARAIAPDVPCPACGAPTLAMWRPASASDPHLAGRASFTLARCPACGSAVTLLEAAPPSGLYEGGTYAPARRGLGALVGPLRRLAEWDRLRFARSINPGGSVVEVGAGDGKLVAAMRNAGYAARGIDSSPAACAAAARARIPVENAGIENASVKPASLDGVVMWHALEHFDDPAAALSRVHGWLREGGAAIVAVPNLASLQARIGGDDWFHQDVPRHRTHFTPEGLTALLTRSGFGVERVRHLLIEQNPLGMWQTLLNRLTAERDFFFRLLKRDVGTVPRARLLRDLVITLMVGPLLAPLAVLLELGAGLRRQGGSIVAEATAR